MANSSSLVAICFIVLPLTLAVAMHTHLGATLPVQSLLDSYIQSVVLVGCQGSSPPQHLQEKDGGYSSPVQVLLHPHAWVLSKVEGFSIQ